MEREIGIMRGEREREREGEKERKWTEGRELMGYSAVGVKKMGNMKE